MDNKKDNGGLELRTFSLMGRMYLPLYVSPCESFIPNSTTRLLTKVMRKVMQPGDTVFDIGAGVGPLAIWAAKSQADQVYAVEIVPEQYEVMKKNIRHNNVGQKVAPYCGSLFDPIPDGTLADMIVASVSAVAEGPAEIWYSLNVPNGGEDGTDNIVPALQQARHYMKDGASLIFPALVGIANAHKIMETAHANYSTIEKMIEVPIPLRDKDLERFSSTARGRPYLQLFDYNGEKCWLGQIYAARDPR